MTGRRAIFAATFLRDTVGVRLAGPFVPGAVLRGPHRDAAGRPLLYVTLDDGPNADGTPRLLDALAACDAHAVAFLSADRAAAFPDLARQWATGGHRAGNHGGAHRSAWAVPRGEAVREMARGERVLESVLGEAVRDVRPPYGRVTPGLVRWVREFGADAAGTEAPRRLVLWDTMPGDYLPSAGPAVLAERLVRAARPGGIVVLHDGAPAARAAAALRLALPRLAAAGWRFPALPPAPFGRPALPDLLP
ncbi:MAG TPA: polysaccharide deacetylase family protein [Rubricoccaceae bacterium]